MIEKIPITLDFDMERIIGYAEIETELLPQVPNYHFALGYQIKDATYSDNKFNVLEHELLVLSLVPDTKFRGND